MIFVIFVVYVDFGAELVFRGNDVIDSLFKYLWFNLYLEVGYDLLNLTCVLGMLDSAVAVGANVG